MSASQSADVAREEARREAMLKIERLKQAKKAQALPGQSLPDNVWRGMPVGLRLFLLELSYQNEATDRLDVEGLQWGQICKAQQMRIKAFCKAMHEDTRDFAALF